MSEKGFEEWWRNSGFYKKQKFECFFFGMGYCLVKRFGFDAGLREIEVRDVTFFIFHVASKKLLTTAEKYSNHPIWRNGINYSRIYRNIVVHTCHTFDAPTVTHQFIGGGVMQTSILTFPMTSEQRNLLNEFLLKCISFPAALSSLVLDYLSVCSFPSFPKWSKVDKV